MPQCARSRSLEPRCRDRKKNFLIQGASFSLACIFFLYASMLFWNAFVLQPQITTMKSSLNSLKETVNSIGAAYDNLRKDVLFLNDATSPKLGKPEYNDYTVNYDIPKPPFSESKTDSDQNVDNIEMIDKKTQKSLIRLGSGVESHKMDKKTQKSQSNLHKVDTGTSSKYGKSNQQQRDHTKASNMKKRRTSSEHPSTRNKYAEEGNDESFKRNPAKKTNYPHTITDLNISKINQTTNCNTIGDVSEAGTLTEKGYSESGLSKGSHLSIFKEVVGLHSADPFWNDIEFWFKDHQQKHKPICKRRLTIPSV